MSRLRARVSMVAVTALLLLGVAGFAGVAPASAAFVNGDEVVVFDGSLNLRQTPGLTGLILQVLPDGAPLTVTGGPTTADAIEWYPVVAAAAVNGFVSGEFIMLAPTGGEFTVGDNIVMGEGKSPSDTRTLAHELTHVVQQRQGEVPGESIGGGIKLSDPGDWAERQAEATADHVTSGGGGASHAGHDHSGGGAAAGVQREAAEDEVQALAIQREAVEEEGDEKEGDEAGGGAEAPMEDSAEEKESEE